MKPETINIPDNLKVSFTAKEVGEIRDYLANTFTHAQVDNVIQFLSGRMIQSYQAETDSQKIRPAQMPTENVYSANEKK